IEKQLRQRYDIDIDDKLFVQTVYADELERFKNGVFGELVDHNLALFAEKRVDFLAGKVRVRYEHVGQSVLHLVTRAKRQIVIVLDNSDQRSNDVQIEAFAVAHEMAQWGALVFAAMRPQTYLSIRQQVALASRAERVFTIAPPLIEEVVKRRLQFAVDIAE